MKKFESINAGYNNTFQAEELTVGVVIPIEYYPSSPIPDMQNHLQKVQFIEKLGFKALWVRDIPLNIPSFGDAGQTFDPFTYLGFLAGQTIEIALGVASIALPLHHPIHIAKSAATIDQLSAGRLILGVASGDRPDEYPSMGINYEQRGQLFREAFNYIRNVQQSFPKTEKSTFGVLNGYADVLPKPFGLKLPLVVTGNSRQTLEWNAKHSNGWMNYPKSLCMQKYNINQWRELVKKFHEFDKPFMQPLYVILERDENFKTRPIPLGIRTGIKHLLEYLQNLKEIGVNHVALNLRFNHSDTYKTLEMIAKQVLPNFHNIK